MAKYVLGYFLLIVLIGCASSKNTLHTNKELLTTVNKDLADAEAQYLFFCSQVPAERFPRSLDKDGRLVTSDSKWWCSGFYPGTLLYLNENTPNDSLLHEAKRKLALLKPEQYNKSTHDLGFMMYCSYGNANRLQPDAAYRDILINSARSLCSRFNPITGTIRSWDSNNENEFLVIIDNMMNLELLFYATRVTGDSTFYKIAVSHADNTLKNHFRPDFSSWHVLDYDAKTGLVTSKRTAQGAADNSSWARGQAWALYGFTLMFRETKNSKYLEQANGIAHFILDHPNLPADKIPFWDYNAPGIPAAPRDASAAAISASALIELSTYNKGVNRANFLKAAETIITSLSSPTYKSSYGQNKGFLLNHSVGHLPAKSEVNVPLTYADYYYVEALMRYKKMAYHKSLFSGND